MRADILAAISAAPQWLARATEAGARRRACSISRGAFPDHHIDLRPRGGEGSLCPPKAGGDGAVRSTRRVAGRILAARVSLVQAIIEGDLPVAAVTELNVRRIAVAHDLTNEVPADASLSNGRLHSRWQCCVALKRRRGGAGHRQCGGHRQAKQENFFSPPSNHFTDILQYIRDSFETYFGRPQVPLGDRAAETRLERPVVRRFRFRGNDG